MCEYRAMRPCLRCAPQLPPGTVERSGNEAVPERSGPMATSVQRQALRWMIENGGTMMIVTGHKTVRRGTVRKTDQPVIAGNSVFLHGMKMNKFIEPVTDTPWIDHLYRVTDFGRKHGT